MEGYNIAFKINGKTLMGRTQDDLTITPRVKESLTKDDAGVAQETVTGHDITFRAAGLILSDAGSTSKLSNTEIMDLALETGDTKFPITYLRGDVSYTGYARITNYSETSDAEADKDATYSLDCKTVGSLTKVVSQSP